MPLILRSLPSSPIMVKKHQSIVLIGVFTKGWKRMKNCSIALQEGARADIRFFFLGSGANAFPLRCTSQQYGKDSFVRISFRSVLFDSSSIDESTLLTIEKRAHNADAHFSHHILLASPVSKGKTTPSFEIHTDSIHAKHAASVSTIDAEARYYLASRGCDTQTADRILIHGFLTAEFNSLDEGKTKKELEYKIDSFLQKDRVYAS